MIRFSIMRYLVLILISVFVVLSDRVNAGQCWDVSGVCAKTCGAGYAISAGNTDGCNTTLGETCCIRESSLVKCKGTCKDTTTKCDTTTEKEAAGAMTDWCNDTFDPVGQGLMCCIPKEGYETTFDCDVIKEQGKTLLYPVCALRALATMGTYVTNMTSIIAVIGVVIMLILGGFWYITAQDDAGQLEKARNAITWAIIGAIVAVSAYIIMRLVSAILNINIYADTNNIIYAQQDIVSVQENQVTGKIFAEVEKNPLPNSQVFLYTNSDGKWQLWQAEKFDSQRNPQVVNENSEYLFLVPKGEYYIRVLSEGYFNKDSERFVVQDKPVRVNVYMTKASPLWKVILGFGVGVFVITVIVVGVKAFKLWTEKQRIKRSVLRRVDEATKKNLPDFPENNPQVN